MRSDGDAASGWFRKADDDLRAAGVLLDEDDALCEVACYHAQQCAEKYLKGYLVAQHIAFRFVHELAYLVRLCMDDDSGFSDILDAASVLQEYATDVRYPSEEAEPLTPHEAQEAMRLAEQIRDLVLTKMEGPAAGEACSDSNGDQSEQPAAEDTVEPEEDY